MALNKSTFETINPSRFTTFTFPNPQNPTSLLRVAVLDSPIPPADSPQVAAMFVPSGRESDWIFSSESGHLQLLLSSISLSRLILVGNHLPGGSCRTGALYRRLNASEPSHYAAELLRPLFLALSPKSSFDLGIPVVPVLSYEDVVVSSVVLGVFIGDLVGEMLVEDVEIENEKRSYSSTSLEREFRRRLRFKRMPNLVQTEIQIVPESGLESEGVGIENLHFSLNLEVLVHPYLAPMIASLVLISGFIDETLRRGSKPRALCLGVGGGALVTFLATSLSFDVVGVEQDEEVLRVGKEFFALEEGEFVNLHVGDAAEFLERQTTPFDVVMVDLDSPDIGNGACAPAREFCTTRALACTRSILSEKGLVAVNVVAHSADTYESVKRDFREVFGELYEIDVGNGENFVLIAAVSKVASLSDINNSFADKLKSAISGEFMDSITKI